MSASNLSKFLIFAGLLIVPVITAFTTMTVVGPYIGFPLPSGSLSHIVIEILSGILLPTGTAVLCLWAAHNLQRLSFLKSRQLISLCSIAIWAQIAACVITLLLVPLFARLYGSGFGGTISSVGYFLMTCAYALCLIGLLSFAKRQLVALEAKTSILKNPIEEVFE